MSLFLFAKRKATQRQKEGRKGEEIARRFFSCHGYKIIGTNYRTRYGEIDLICQKKNLLVFVEVRKKKLKEFGEPKESISLRKIQRIKKAAEYFLSEKGIDDKEIRFDLFAIMGKKFELITNAF